MFLLVGKWTFSSSSSLEESGAFLVGNVGISLVNFLFFLPLGGFDVNFVMNVELLSWKERRWHESYKTNFSSSSWNC